MAAWSWAGSSCCFLNAQPQHPECSSAASLSFQLRNRFKKKVPPGAEAAHVAVGEVEFLEKPFAAFIRLRRGVSLGSLAEVSLPSR